MVDIFEKEHKEQVTKALLDYSKYYGKEYYNGPFVAFAYSIKSSSVQNTFSSNLDIIVTPLSDDYYQFSQGISLLENKIFTKLKQTREELDQSSKMRFKIELLSLLNSKSHMKDKNYSGLLFVSVGAHFNESFSYWGSTEAMYNVDEWGNLILIEGLKSKLKPSFGISNYNFNDLEGHFSRNGSFTDERLEKLLKNLEITSTI